MIRKQQTTGLVAWSKNLLNNSRFWVLSSGIAASFLVAGFIQLYVIDPSLQSIRIEQWYGFISLFFLYLALLASPFTKTFPRFPINNTYLHVRRAIGVLAFYYAFLHVYITFFSQLNGFAGLGYLDAKYLIAVLLGFSTLLILFAMAVTSTDWAIRVMTFRNWKRLHRFIYVAGTAVVVHVLIIGPHFTSLSLTGVVCYIAAAFLLILQAYRIYLNTKHGSKAKRA